MKLRVSMAFNVLLMLAVAALAWFGFRRDLDARSYKEERPRGPLLALPHDQPIYDSTTGTVAFVLPKGTVLQDSTPVLDEKEGAISGREYVLVFHSDEPAEVSNFLDEYPGWVKRYRFNGQLKTNGQ